MLKWILSAICVFIWVILMLIYRKNTLTLCVGMLIGEACLAGIYFFGHIFGIYISINFFTALVSLVLGIPGIALLVICGFLC